MKACPVCKTALFEDMEVCYGCMHRFGDDAGGISDAGGEGGEGGKGSARALPQSEAARKEPEREESKIDKGDSRLPPRDGAGRYMFASSADSSLDCGGPSASGELSLRVRLVVEDTRSGQVLWEGVLPEQTRDEKKSAGGSSPSALESDILLEELARSIE